MSNCAEIKQLLLDRIQWQQSILDELESLESIAVDANYYALAGLLGYEGCAPFTSKHQLFVLRREMRLFISDGTGGPQVEARLSVNASPIHVTTWGEAYTVIFGVGEESV